MATQECNNNPEAVWRGLDGKAYKCVDGKTVEVSTDLLILQGYNPPQEIITLNGRVYGLIKGNFYYIPDPENADRNQQLITDPQQIAELKQHIANKNNEKYLLIGGLALVVLLLIRR